MQPSSRLRSIFTPFVLRVILGIIWAFFTFVSAKLNHKCARGYPWFEAYEPMIVSGIVFLVVLVWRWIVPGLMVGALVGVIFALGVKPWYLQWIHGPNAPASFQRSYPVELNDPKFTEEMVAKYERQRRERESADFNQTQATASADRPSIGARQSAPSESPKSEK